MVTLCGRIGEEQMLKSDDYDDNLIVPTPPTIPAAAVEFAKELGGLAEKYQLANVKSSVKVYMGHGSRYNNAQNICQEVTVSVSRFDGRGRPRTNIIINADTSVTYEVRREPDSTD
jgi:hypothetical protein